MELEEEFRPEQIVKTGQEIIDITANQYLQIRSGNPASPDVNLQEQIPEGKKWTATINITIVETDA